MSKNRAGRRPYFITKPPRSCLWKRLWKNIIHKRSFFSSQGRISWNFIDIPLVLSRKGLISYFTQPAWSSDRERVTFTRIFYEAVISDSAPILHFTRVLIIPRSYRARRKKKRDPFCFSRVRWNCARRMRSKHLYQPTYVPYLRYIY